MAGREGAARPGHWSSDSGARGLCSARSLRRTSTRPCAVQTLRCSVQHCAQHRRTARSAPRRGWAHNRGHHWHPGRALFQRHARACPACPLALWSTALPAWLGVWTHRQCLVHVKAAAASPRRSGRRVETWPPVCARRGERKRCVEKQAQRRFLATEAVGARRRVKCHAAGMGRPTRGACAAPGRALSVQKVTWHRAHSASVSTSTCACDT